MPKKPKKTMTLQAIDDMIAQGVVDKMSEISEKISDIVYETLADKIEKLIGETAKIASEAIEKEIVESVARIQEQK